MAATSKKQRARARKTIEHATAYGNHDVSAEATRLQRQLLKVKLFHPTREELDLIPHILNKLPAEIRLMIYEYAFEPLRGKLSRQPMLWFDEYEVKGRRPIRPGVHSARYSEPRGTADARRIYNEPYVAEPALLRVCRTFRVEAMKPYCCFLSAEEARLMEILAEEKASVAEMREGLRGKFSLIYSILGSLYGDENESRLERIRKEKRRLRGRGLCLGVRRPVQDVESSLIQEAYEDEDDSGTESDEESLVLNDGDGAFVDSVCDTYRGLFGVQVGRG